MAVRTLAFCLLLLLAYHGCRYDSRRYGNDGVTGQHDNGRQESPYRSNGGNVAIAYGGHGNNSPVDTIGNVVEFSTGYVAFNHVHDCSHGGNQDEDKKEKYGYFRCADAQGAQQQITFTDEREQLEDAEYPDEPEGPDDQQVVCTLQEEAQVNRQGGQQVHQPEKAEYVFPGIFQAVNTGQVFYGKEESQQVFQ